MAIKHFEAISEYVGIICWFVVLIAAKLSHISTRKKMTRGQVVMNIIYGIVGGVMAYFGAAAFNYNIRIITTGIGVLAGDVLVSWVPKNAESFLDTVGEFAKKWISRKKDDK